MYYITNLRPAIMVGLGKVHLEKGDVHVVSHTHRCPRDCGRPVRNLRYRRGLEVCRGRCLRRSGYRPHFLHVVHGRRTGLGDVHQGLRYDDGRQLPGGLVLRESGL